MNNEEKIIQMLTEMVQTMTKTNEKVNDIETRTSGMEGQLISIETRITNIEVTQENTVVPQIQLLAEGHATIQNQIRNISVIDQLQDDISILKSAVSFLSHELADMKKAM